MSRHESTDRVTLRLVLYKNEVCRLPREHQGIIVREGVAWMTRDGEDAVLCAGESVRFGRGKWATVVSALTGPLVIEVIGAAHPRSPAIFGSLQHRQVAGGCA
jgi:hypothetical protein